MTSEVTTHIGLADILAFRLECTDCHAVTEMPIDSKGTDNFMQALFKCPHCGAQWFRTQSDSRLNEVRSLMAYLRDARKIVPDLPGQGVALDLSFKIASGVAPASGGKD